jgi:hypothetical protein
MSTQQQPLGVPTTPTAILRVFVHACLWACVSACTASRSSGILMTVGPGCRGSVVIGADGVTTTATFIITDDGTVTINGTVVGTCPPGTTVTLVNRNGQLVLDGSH